MSGIVHAGKMQAIDSNKIGTHGVNLENVDESLTGLNVDFAQSCVLEDPRGQINLTFSQPVEVTVDDSLGTLTNQYDNAGNRSTGEESEQRDTIREMPQFSRSSSDGMSYATALSNLEDVSAAKKESSLSNRGSGQVIKVAIGPQHFDLLKLIGEGAFGKVIMVKNLLDQKIYAMKVISKKLLRKKNSISYMKSERDILTKVNHPFVVSLFFAFQTEKKIFLVMDFLGGGELFFHLKRRGLILEKEVRFYLAEMVLAIEFLHNKGVIHRDLKPENVLLRVDGHVCITDFGLAKEIGDLESARTLCGTSEYMAPEMLTRNGYGKGVDWWSLGALCYEMLSGKPPFSAKTQKELDRKILSEKITCPSYLTASAHSLLKGMLEKDLNKRLGAARGTMFCIGGVAALKRHPFFEDLDWTDLINLRISPPIDLSIPYVTPTTPHTPTQNTAKPSNKGSDLPSPCSPVPKDTETDSDGCAINPNGPPAPQQLALTMEHLTRHFHEEFTGKHISLSDVEENNSTSSLAGSESTLGGGEFVYDGFEFVGEGFECSVDQVKKFEDDLIVKTAKLIKKKKMKTKKDGEKADKQLQSEKEKYERELIEKEAKRVKEENDRVKQEQTKAAAERAARTHARSAARSKRLSTVRAMQTKIDTHAQELDVIQKKLKGLRKKMRDIEELAARVDGGLKPSKEQKEKLEKRQSVEDDIAEMEEAEEVTAAATPPAIPAALLVEEEPEAEEGDPSPSIPSPVSALPSPALAHPPKGVPPTPESTVPVTVAASRPVVAADSGAAQQWTSPADKKKKKKK